MIRSALLFFCCLISPVLASPIVVKSGEHGSFTRLVVYLPADRKWSIEEDGGFSNFSVEGWRDGFDITDVFKKVNTDRLRSLTSTDSNLLVALNCNCRIVTETLDGGFVQLDLLERETRRPLQRPSEDDEKVVSSEPSPSPLERPITTKRIWKLEPLDAPLEILDKVASKQSQKEIDAFGQSLVERLSRGSTLKHLNTPPTAEIESSPDLRITEFQEEEDLLAILAERAQFSDSASRDRRPEDLAETSKCVNASVLEVSSWGGPGNFHDQLSELRANLIGEFDNEVAGAKSVLAKFYLHFGLAEEALQIIRGLEEAVPIQAMLHLANLIKDDFSNQNDKLHSFVNCAGEAKLWATIAGPSEQTIDEDTAKTLIATFLNFPDHLQLLVAKKLANIFSIGGNFLAADIVKNALARKVDNEADPQSKKKLVIDLLSLSRDELMAQVSLNHADAPEAMALFLEVSVRDRQAITVADSDLASAFAFQLDGSKISSRLEAALILALAISGFPERSLQEFILLKEDLKREFPDTLNRLMEIFLQQKNQNQLVELAWRMSKADDKWVLSEIYKLNLAHALVDMGQPQLVKQLILNFEEEHEVYFLGQALILEGQYASAAELLKDSENSKMRETYLELVSIYQPDTAWAQRDDFESGDLSRLAWSVGEWSNVSKNVNRAEIAATILDTEGEIKVSTKPISSARGIYETSRKSRASLERLFAQPTL